MTSFSNAYKLVSSNSLQSVWKQDDTCTCIPCKLALNVTTPEQKPSSFRGRSPEY